MVRHHNSLLEVPHPTIPCVKKTRKNHLDLHIHRNLDLHHAAVSVQPGQGCFLEGM